MDMVLSARSGPAAPIAQRSRISATPAARALIAQLQESYGALMFHQAGGSKEASLPLCFVRGDFPLVEVDVLLGEIDGVPFYVSHGQSRRYANTEVRLDAIAGRAGVFSLERPTGLRFATTAQPLPRAQRVRSRR